MIQFWLSNAWLAPTPADPIRDINGAVLSVGDSVIVPSRIVGISGKQVLVQAGLLSGQPIVGLDSLAVMKI